jgi:type III restriction enzyme
VNFKTTRPCIPTWKSQVNQVVLDTSAWEQEVVTQLEASDSVQYYVRNDHLGLLIPYEYQRIEHCYEPDFIVKLKNGITMLLEIKGYEDDQDKAKHNTAKRWISAVNNWGKLGKWDFMVCRNPNEVGEEMRIYS